MTTSIRDSRAVLPLVTVYLVWGSTYLAIKIAVDTLPPFLMAASRFWLAGAILYGWSIRRGERVGDRPGYAQWRAAFVVGGFMLVGGNGAVSWAELRIDSSIAALLVATVPLWMALIARFRDGERLSRFTLAGLVLGFGGVALLVRPDPTSGVDTVGALTVVGGALAWAWGSVRSRSAALPSRPLVSTSMQMLAAAALFTVISVATGEPWRLDPDAVTGASIWAVLYLVFAGSILAFSAYVWLLRAVSTSVVSTYAYVNPVVAVVLGAAILSEAITPTTLVAGAVIVLAVALIVGGRPRPGRDVAPAAPSSGTPALPAPERA